MRFQFFMGMVCLLLSLGGSEGAMFVSTFCNTTDWYTHIEILQLKVCFLPPIDGNFSILSESDPEVKGFTLEGQKNLTLLPTNVFEVFPNLFAYRIRNTAVTSVNKDHFKGLAELKHLSLHGNKIDHVAHDSFTDLVELEYLYLSSNQIKNLEENTFSPLKALIRLELDDNHIATLPSGIFSPLANLEQIDLSGNEFVSLDEHVFEHMTSLKHVYMNKNKLTTLPVHLFKDNVNLYSLYASINKIAFLDGSMFDHLPGFNYIGLEKNVCIDRYLYVQRPGSIKKELDEACGVNSTHNALEKTSA